MDEYLRMKDVARQMKVSRNTPYRWSAEGKLTTVKTASGIVRVKRADLETFVTGGRTGKAKIKED
jgi:excisionase family DNA binding protein